MDALSPAGRLPTGRSNGRGLPSTLAHRTRHPFARFAIRLHEKLDRAAGHPAVGPLILPIGEKQSALKAHVRVIDKQREKPTEECCRLQCPAERGARRRTSSTTQTTLSETLLDP
jgi:hypothetical protein